MDGINKGWPWNEQSNQSGNCNQNRASRYGENHVDRVKTRCQITAMKVSIAGQASEA
jgi:hypothetical protein